MSCAHSCAIESDSADEELDALWRRVVARRSFLRGVGLAGGADAAHGRAR